MSTQLRDSETSEEGGGKALAAALVCLVTVVAFETMSVATIMPDVKADIGGLSLYGWVFSGLALGEVLGIVLAGSWADRANPAQPIMAGLAVYTVGLVVSGTANSMFVVVVGRVLQGFGAGTVPAVAYVCVGRGFVEAERARVFAWMATAWIVPSVVGPTAASVISEHAGWRMVFLGLIPIVVGVGALAIRPISSLGRPAGADSVARSARRTVFLAVVAVVGAGVALGGLQSTQLALLIALVLGGGVALVWAFRQITPVGTLRIARGLPAAIAVRGMLTFAFLGADAYVALALTNVRGTSTLFAGVVLSSPALTWTGGSWVSARFIAKVGPRLLVSVGLVLVTVGIASMATVIDTDVSPRLAIVAWALGGLGIGLAYSPLSQAALSAADPAHLGETTSALQLSDTLGFALGSGIGGAFVAIAEDRHLVVDGSEVHAGVSMVWALTAFVAVVGVISSRRMSKMLGDERSGAAASAE